MLEQDPRPVVPQATRSIPVITYLRRMLTILAIALAIVLLYGLHERGLAAHYAAQASIDNQDLRAQVGALTAKLNSLANKEAVVPAQPTPVIPVAIHKAAKPGGNRQKPDPRFKKLQAQLDAQGKDIESTRQEISNARTDLEGSIARTHEELVVLEKRGERSYFEFDLDKSKNFRPEGPVGVSLRKANVKHQYADLELVVDDRQISKKHLNLYEPAVFYPAGERQAVELIINSITKNHIHGYISAPKYRASELASSSTANNDEKAQQTDQPKARRKLEVPR